MNRRPTGFFNAPDNLHPPLRVRKHIFSSSGALNGGGVRRLQSSCLSSSSHHVELWLDYSPLIFRGKFHIYISYARLSEKVKNPNYMKIIGLPAKGRGNHPNPFRTRKLNRAPSPVLVRSSAARSWGSWQPTFLIYRSHFNGMS